MTKSNSSEPRSSSRTGRAGGLRNSRPATAAGAFVIAMSALSFIGEADAAEQEKNITLANASGCFICHSIEAKTYPKGVKPLAPSYQEVARRYAGKKGAASMLASRILKGSLGKPQNWRGQVSMQFMPPNVNIDKGTADKLAKWILSLKGDVPARLVRFDDMMARARNSGCLTCHSVNRYPDRRYVPLAPAFNSIAERYRTKKSSVAYLTETVVKGSLGRERQWKEVNMQFMPPNVNLTEAEARALVQWILTLR